ncbi:MAG: response regulator transcription factor [bacterium]|nr:response regulator transcription factor [bacterium]MCM1374787.1 response regulator transcription factor [Muribaculum sp.]
MEMILTDAWNGERKMLRVLLVDDEPFILQGLSMLIDWGSEGYEIVGRAGSAREALTIIQQEKPDLVLVDIRMPQMSGLELLEEVRRNSMSHACFVIMSGYSDFEYARTAMKWGCIDYLLKPISREELLNILRRVRILKEEEERKERDDSLIAKEFFSRNMIALIRGKFDEDNVKCVKQYLGDCHGCRYICVEIDDSAMDGRMPDEERRIRQKQLYQWCLKELPGEEYRCVFDISVQGENHDVAIIYSDELLSKKSGITEQEYLRQWRRRLTGGLDFPVRMVAGSKVDSLEQIADSVRTVRMARLLRGLELGEDLNDIEELNWAPLERRLGKEETDELIHMVKQNQKEAIAAGAQRLYDELYQMDSRTADMVFHYLFIRLLRLAIGIDENLDQHEVLRFISRCAFEQTDMEDGRNAMVTMLLDYGDYLMQLRRNQSQAVLDQIESDMRANYRENLTLKDMGAKYFINAAYLGQIFKKQYGETFKDHLNRIRIEYAEEFLLHTDMKIYEIAERVGYKDSDYFINRFLAVKGCTPTKFRKQTADSAN